MKIKRLMNKSGENCSCCGNKSIKPFEILIIENVLKEHIFFICHKDNNGNQNNFFWLSRETSILINNWFMMYFLSVVLIGTVYPIFLDVISSEKISVGPPFYHKLIAPFLIPFLTKNCQNNILTNSY